jgi:hypothetical protein
LIRENCGTIYDSSAKDYCQRAGEIEKVKNLAGLVPPGDYLKRIISSYDPEDSRNDTTFYDNARAVALCVGSYALRVLQLVEKNESFPEAIKKVNIPRLKDSRTLAVEMSSGDEKRGTEAKKTLENALEVVGKLL